MPDAARTPPPRACPTDPPKDPDATALPPNLARVLRVVQILLTYGRHLADTLARRSIAPGFHLIARAFGTGRPAIILAHIRRGILRAAALERVLLDRAASGRDLTLPPFQARISEDPEKREAQPIANPQEAPPARKPPPRPSWRDDWLDNVEDPLDPRHQPTFEKLLAQARRRPIGRSIGDICADLGIAPSLCLSPFWNELYMIILGYNGSAAVYDVRRWRREEKFSLDQERLPTMDRSWPKIEVGPDRPHVPQVLGFFIGQDPAEPPLIRPRQDRPGEQAAPPVPPPQAASANPPAQHPAASATGPP